MARESGYTLEFRPRIITLSKAGELHIIVENERENVRQATIRFLLGEKPLILTHITHTGRWAGLPLCGVKKTEGHFCHAPYGRLDKFLARVDLCQECKAAWEAEDD